MKINHLSFYLLATVATGILAMSACQNSTQPSNHESGPIKAVASYTMGSFSRLPDSISWKSPKDSGSRKQKCHPTTLACSDTFQLSQPLGRDSIALELWTLGIRTYILHFGEQGSSKTLGLKPSAHCDFLDTLLLSKYNTLTTTQKAAFSALGQGASSLVAFYASLLLSADTSFVGKPLPVGMSRTTVDKHLVYLAAKQGLPIEQLLAKNLLPGLDSVNVLKVLKSLIEAKALDAGDSSSLVPPYPVRVKTALAVKGPLTAGGKPVSITGAFAWTKGRNIKAPVIQVRTAKAEDSAHFTTPTKLFTSTDTVWTLDGNLSLQASSAASAGIDTLVITLSDDAGHSTTSRTPIEVVSSASAPSFSPDGGTFYTPQNVKVSAPGADSLQTSTDSANWTKYTAAVPVASSTRMFARAFKGGAASPVASATFVIGSVPVPKITPNGGSFFGAETVVVEASGADSLQTSTDSANWTKYTTKIVVISTGKLHARALKGGATSAVATASFTASTAPVPTIAPNGGVFYAAQSISVLGPTGSDSVQTSTDSAVWTKTPQSLTLSTSGKLFARSFTKGAVSPVISASFTFKTVPIPTILPDGGTFYAAPNVTVSAPETDSIQISMDSANWTKYSTALAISDTTKLHARAFKGGVASAVVSASFVRGTVPVPSITPNGGSFYGSTSVSVAASETDSIQISTDSANWTRYSTALVVTTTTKLHARAFKGGTVSAVSSATFTSSAIPVPTFSPNGGTFYSAPAVTITAPAGTDSIQTSRDSIAWTRYTQAVSVSSSGKLFARSFAGGVPSPIVSASFTLAAVPVPRLTPDGGTFYAAQSVVVAAAGTDSVQTSTDSLVWTKVTAAVPVTTSTKLHARAFKDGVASEVVLASFVIAAVPVPVFSPNGGVVSIATNITVTATGADSLQTSLDGTTWTRYAAALRVSANDTLYARAFKGGVASATVTAAFTVPPVPVITPNGGAFTTAKSVTITATTGTIEDSLSTGTGWNTYFTEFPVSSNTKVFARTRLSGVTSAIVQADFAFPPTLTDTISKDTAVAAAKVTVTAPGSDSIMVSTNKLNWSSVRSGGSYSMAAGTLYAFSKTGSASSSVDSILVKLYQRAPSISPEGGVFASALNVTLTSSLSGAEIFYTTDGSSPATSATGFTSKYSAPISIGTSKTVKAIAVKSGIVSSAVASATFAIADTNTYGIPWKTGISYGAIQDTRDGQIYRTVKIGSQTWMAENLNYKTDSSWCYENSVDSCAKYGRLYQWSAAMGVSGTYNSTSLSATLPHQGICPSGWHVPSDDEWTKLTDTILSSSTAGTILKSTTYGNGTDTYGFRALPAGYRYYDGKFYEVGNLASFWNSSEFEAIYTWYRYIFSSYNYLDRNYLDKKYGQSVRCLKD